MSRKNGLAYVGMFLAFAMLGAAVTPAATAQPATTSAKKFTNADLLKWPEREQIIWVSGAIEGIGNTLALNNGEAARCVLKWYGNGSTKFSVVRESAKLYPNEEPIAVLLALANRNCKFHQ